MNLRKPWCLWGGLDKGTEGTERDSGTRTVLPVLVAGTSCAGGLRADGSAIWDVSDVASPDRMGSAPPGSGS